MIRASSIITPRAQNLIYLFFNYLIIYFRYLYGVAQFNWFNGCLYKQEQGQIASSETMFPTICETEGG